MSTKIITFLVLSLALLGSIMVDAGMMRRYSSRFPSLEDCFYKEAVSADFKDRYAALTSENQELKNRLAEHEPKLEERLANETEREAERANLLATQIYLSSKLEKSRQENAKLKASLVKIQDDWQVFCLQKKNDREERVMTVERYMHEKNLTNNNTEILASACLNDNVAVVVAMLGLGLKCDTPIDNDKETCMHVSARTNSLELLGQLLARGCDTEVRDKEGWTPIISATFHGQLKAVQELVEHGADLAVRTVSNFTALKWAAETANLEIIEYLQSKGAKE